MGTFIGVDLAWKSENNHSGLALLCGDRSAAELAALSNSVYSLTDALRFVRSHQGSESVVAVDAPLIVRNLTGQRPCETLVGQRYGQRHASCHTSNLTLYPDPASVRFATALSNEGYVHAPDATSDSAPRVMLEVYPHAGQVALFDLPTILKYKKGTVAQKCEGLRSLQGLLDRLTTAKPAIANNALLSALLSENISHLRGDARKRYEDALDAVFAAYLAYYYWYWREDRTEVFGDLTLGYILNPKLLSSRLNKPAA